MTLPARLTSSLLWQRMGGPWATSWSVIALTSGFAVVTNLAGSPGQWSAPLLDRLLVVALGMVGLVAVLRLGRLIPTSRSSGNQRPAATLALFVTASTVYGLVTSWATVALGVSEYPDTAYRVVTSVMLLTTALILATDYVDSLQSYRSRLRELDRTQFMLMDTRDRVTATIVAERTAVIDGVSTLLRKELDALSLDDPAQAVERLRETAHEVVRPLSHQLAYTMSPVEFDAPEVPARRTDWQALINSATEPGAISPVALAGLSTVLMVPFSLTLFPLGYLLVVPPLTFLVLLVLASGLARLQRSLPALGLLVRLPLVLVGLLSIGSLLAVTLWLVVRHLPLGTTVAVIPPFVVLLGLALAWGAAVGGQRVVNAAAIERANSDIRWEVARANEEKWSQQRALARALHGPVQGALNAGAIRLDMAQRDADVTPEMVDLVRASVLQALDVLASVDSADVDPQVAMDRLQGMWRGVCTISTHVDPHARGLILKDPTCGAPLIDIVTEACANAVQHGTATHIDIGISLEDPRSLRVVIADNGRSDVTASAPGLGTSLFDEVCLTWSRHRDAGSSTWTCVLPVLSTS